MQFAQDSLHRNAAVREVSSEGLRIRRAAVDARERCRRGRTQEVAAARERSQLHAPPHALVHTTLCTQAHPRPCLR